MKLDIVHDLYAYNPTSNSIQVLNSGITSFEKHHQLTNSTNSQVKIRIRLVFTFENIVAYVWMI